MGLRMMMVSVHSVACFFLGAVRLFVILFSFIFDIRVGGNPFFFFFFFFFWPRHAEVPRPGIEPMSQQPPEPQQRQRWIPNLPSPKGTPG